MLAAHRHGQRCRVSAWRTEAEGERPPGCNELLVRTSRRPLAIGEYHGHGDLSLEQLNWAPRSGMVAAPFVRQVQPILGWGGDTERQKDSRSRHLTKNVIGVITGHDGNSNAHRLTPMCEPIRNGDDTATLKDEVSEPALGNDSSEEIAKPPEVVADISDIRWTRRDCNAHR